jgi:uncharacterized membrane protein YphA (DoxX/SURF4 family)
MPPPTIELERDPGRRDPEFSTTDPAKDQAEVHPAWTPAQRVLFRFLFAYLVLYIFPFPVDGGPYGAYTKFWNDLVPRVGRQVFHVEITVHPTGSGDTAFDYVRIFCFAVLAAVAAAIWTLLDRGRTAYPTLHRWLRVYVRFYLASVMITYGSTKVIKSQFPNPTLDRLLQPFGDASPMGLLWTFMGVSVSYNIFTGAGELLGGLLLTTRRTTLLGSLVCFGVMSHVAMLNFSYDVPVKLFSMHLLSMSLLLMAPDLDRLARMFVLNRAVEPVVFRPLWRWKWVDRGALMLRTLWVALLLGTALYGAQETRKMYGDLMPKSPLYGIWNVEEFEVDGQARPPLVTDEQRWRRVIFDFPKTIAIQLMSDSRRRYTLDLDPGANTMALGKRDDPAWKARLSYTQPEPGRLAMEGALDGQRITARMRRVDTSEFLLMSRGFHWVNEYPFNR